MMQSGSRTSTATNQSPPSNAQIEQQIREHTEAALRASADAQAAAAQARGQGGPVFVGPVPPGPPIGPGFTMQPDHDEFGGGFPPQVVDIAMGFFIMCAVIIIGWPLARAFGKRIERRAAEPDPHMAEQLQRIERAVDTMAVEIERISESQRFQAKLQSQNAPALSDRR